MGMKEHFYSVQLLFLRKKRWNLPKFTPSLLLHREPKYFQNCTTCGVFAVLRTAPKSTAKPKKHPKYTPPRWVFKHHRACSTSRWPISSVSARRANGTRKKYVRQRIRIHVGENDLTIDCWAHRFLGTSIFGNIDCWAHRLCIRARIIELVNRLRVTSCFSYWIVT